MAALDLDVTFDYIVVGGGTAGVTVASRLSEDESVRVVVIEAGPDHSNNPVVLIPGLAGAQYGQDQYDWNFASVPQPHLNNRRINQCRGRQLGGSSALNFMLALYPSKAGLDAWGELGNPGWSYNVLAPYLQKFSTFHPPSTSAKTIITSLDKHHNESLFAAGESPVQLSFSEGYTSELNGAWMETFSNLGLNMTADPRTGKAIGAFQNAATIDPATHTRSWAASAYLGPKVRNRPNLVVLTETLVKKIILEENKDVVATGVVIQQRDGSEKTIHARLEVILAAGALQSPQILELSGIGNRQLLQKHAIPVVLDNPNVGENLQDHPMVCQNFEVQDGIPSADPVMRDPSMINALLEMYTSAGAGPLGQSNISVAYAPLADHHGTLTDQDHEAILDKHFHNPSSSSKTAYSRSKQFDIQRSLAEQSGEPTAEYLLFPSNGSYPDEPKSLADILVTSRPENFITIMTVLSHPFSRGSVHITSPDINVKPIWDPNYMSQPLDMEFMARSIQFVERIVNTEPFSSKVLKDGGVRLPDIIADNLERAKDIIRQRQLSIFHVAGSCAMLPKDEGGVVNERLLVYETKNIRVVDASIFPIEPLGNILSTVYAVAERAADIIAEDRRRSFGAVKV